MSAYAIQREKDLVTHEAPRLDASSHMERLRVIYDTHYPFVRRSLRFLGVPEQDIRDAMQNVFLVVIRRLGEFEERSSMQTWLFGIAVRVAHASRRARIRIERLEQTFVPPTPPSVPEDAVAHREAAAVLEQLLNELDDNQRAVFVMADLEGMRAHEIAEALDVKLNTVYSRLRLARAKFERGLARYRDSPEEAR